MFYTYILNSAKDDGFYIGYTSDLKKRYTQHTEGKVKATSYRRPLRLCYYEAYETKQSAMIREKQLKRFGSAYTALMKRLGYK